ncbi:hypothetical protein [Glaciecola sp. MF2-115]|uniref:hypothetical protein n=1 Tax=Glaciecola sp. MF2-115 TaxID=3384827 RepID=UPI0039A3CEFB
MGKLKTNLTVLLFSIAVIAIVTFALISLYDGQDKVRPIGASTSTIASTDELIDTSIPIKPTNVSSADTSLSQEDLSAISDISREHELCLAEARSLYEEEKVARAKLNDLLNRNKFSTSELQRVLKYLVDAGLINFHDAATAMDYFYIQSSAEKLPAFTGNELKSMSPEHPIKSMFLELHSLLKSTDKAGLQAFWEKLNNSDFRGLRNGTDKPHKLGSRATIIRSTSTIDSLVSAYISHYPDLEFSQWIAENISLDASAIVVAIEQKLPDELIINMMNNSRDKSLAVANHQRSVSTPLLSAAMNDRIVLLEHLLQANKFNQPVLAIPPNNRYLAKALLRLQSPETENQLSQEQISILQLFSNYQRPLVFVRDQLGKRRLLGFPYLNVVEDVVEQLRKNNIVARMLSKSKYADESELPNTARYEMPELANRIVDLKAVNIETGDRCIKLKKQQSQLIPAFAEASEVDEVIQEGLPHQEAIARLKVISPVMVDLYYKNAMTKLPEADKAFVESALSAIQENGSAESIQSTTAELGPHQQHHLSIALCEVMGSLSVEKIIQLELFVDKYVSAFTTCFFEKADTAANAELRRHMKSNDGTLSRIYKAVSRFEYSKAAELMEFNYPSHGFEHGRDALALLLDHILSQSDVNIEQKNMLLEQLLSSTPLQDMHYRRLHRLKLKWPMMYQEMVSKFEEVSKAEDYPISSYNSY